MMPCKWFGMTTYLSSIGDGECLGCRLSFGNSARTIPPVGNRPAEAFEIGEGGVFNDGFGEGGQDRRPH